MNTAEIEASQFVAPSCPAFRSDAARIVSCVLRSEGKAKRVGWCLQGCGERALFSAAAIPGALRFERTNPKTFYQYVFMRARPASWTVSSPQINNAPRSLLPGRESSCKPPKSPSCGGRRPASRQRAAEIRDTPERQREQKRKMHVTGSAAKTCIHTDAIMSTITMSTERADRTHHTSRYHRVREASKSGPRCSAEKKRAFANVTQNKSPGRARTPMRSTQSYCCRFFFFFFFCCVTYLLQAG